LATVHKVSVDISVVLGRCVMPVHQMLRLGRGAVIELDSDENDLVEIQANDLTIANGRVVVIGNRIAIEVVEMVRRIEVERAIDLPSDLPPSTPAPEPEPEPIAA
jgi:flagellar motor switch protein FliN